MEDIRILDFSVSDTDFPCDPGQISYSHSYLVSLPVNWDNNVFFVLSFVYSNHSDFKISRTDSVLCYAYVQSLIKWICSLGLSRCYCSADKKVVETAIPLIVKTDE